MKIRYCQENCLIHIGALKLSSREKVMMHKGRVFLEVEIS